MPSYKITTYPVMSRLELGPEASRVISEAQLDKEVGHLIQMEDMGRNYVKLTCQDPSKTVFVIQDSSLVDLIYDGGPNAYLEVVDSD